RSLALLHGRRRTRGRSRRAVDAREGCRLARDRRRRRHDHAPSRRRLRPPPLPARRDRRPRREGAARGEGCARPARHPQPRQTDPVRIAVVVNPAARAGAHRGTANAGAAIRAVERLRAHGHTVTVISGGSAAETSALIRTALEVGTDAVAVVGGDGTVSLAAQELAGTGVPLGLIPTG